MKHDDTRNRTTLHTKREYSPRNMKTSRKRQSHVTQEDSPEMEWKLREVHEKTKWNERRQEDMLWDTRQGDTYRHEFKEPSGYTCWCGGRTRGSDTLSHACTVLAWVCDMEELHVMCCRAAVWWCCSTSPLPKCVAPLPFFPASSFHQAWKPGVKHLSGDVCGEITFRQIRS